MSVLPIEQLRYLRSELRQRNRIKTNHLIRGNVKAAAKEAQKILTIEAIVNVVEANRSKNYDRYEHYRRPQEGAHPVADLRA